MPLFLHGQAVPIQFEQLTADDGLPQNHVQCIYQDDTGFIWFGTLGGLSRYDGYEFVTFHPASSDPYGLNRSVTAICSHTDSTLWIGTEAGLYVFNLAAGTFRAVDRRTGDGSGQLNKKVFCLTRDRNGTLWAGFECAGLFFWDDSAGLLVPYPIRTGTPGTEPGITALLEDNNGRLWAGTKKHGLFVSDSLKESFGPVPLQRADTRSSENAIITAIFQDEQRRIWVGTDQGLYHRDRRDSAFSYIRAETENPARLSDNRINAITQCADGTIWLCLETGLNILDPRTGTFTRINADPLNSRGISQDIVKCMLEDRSGSIWLGTRKGISKTNFLTRPFTYIHAQPSDNRHTGTIVWAVCEDRHGYVWIGTNNGLNRFSPKTGAYEHYQHDPADPASLCGTQVFAICEDHRGTLWFGTGQGLSRLEKDSTSFTNFYHLSEDEGSLSSDLIRTLYLDSRKKLWIGTQNGLNLWLPESGRFRRYPADGGTSSLTNPDIFALTGDNDGRLWIGTWNGLNCLDPESGQIEHYLHDPGNPNSLNNNVARALYIDKNTIIWIGTRGGGLNRFDPKTGKFASIQQSQGLADNWITAIETDQNGGLWLSTNNGLSYYNPCDSVFNIFYKQDGLQSNEFMVGSSFRSDDGRLFFGGLDGLTVFQPQDITIDQQPPRAVLTNVRIIDKNHKLRHHRAICSPGRPKEGYIPEIRLGNDVTVFTLDFSALRFNKPRKVFYQYRMQNLDDQWQALHSRNSAAFSRLPPGLYTFLVRTSLDNSTWSTAAPLLRLYVPPRFWQTLLFRQCLLLALMLLALGLLQLRSIKAKRRDEYLESIINERTRQLTDELERRIAVESRLQDYTASLEHAVKEKTAEVIKLQRKKFRMEKLAAFGKATSTIVHEIRNPLTSIKMGLSALARRLDLNSQDQQCLEVAIIEVIRLERMLRDMLDFTKPLILRFTPHHIGEILDNVLKILNNELEAADIEVRVKAQKHLPQVKLDSDRIAQVFTNLIINAVQSMPKGGAVDIKTALAPGSYLRISISDHGVGIRNEDIPELFEPFFTSKPSGTGLGLTLANKIVTAHSGSLSIESSEGEGTTVTMELPLDPYEQKTCINDINLIQ